MATILAATAPARRTFTVEEFVRMHELGIFQEDDRLELLAGEIIVMSPIGPLHSSLVDQLSSILTLALAGQYTVRVQNPVELSDLSLVYPDLSVVGIRDDNYRTKVPGPQDVLLLIEVADSSVEFDRDEKLPNYAAEGIAEVWIVLAKQRSIEQYWQPVAGAYQQMRSVPRTQEIGSASMPALRLDLPKLFP